MVTREKSKMKVFWTTDGRCQIRKYCVVERNHLQGNILNKIVEYSPDLKNSSLETKTETFRQSNCVNITQSWVMYEQLTTQICEIFIFFLSLLVLYYPYLLHFYLFTPPTSEDFLKLRRWYSSRVLPSGHHPQGFRSRGTGKGSDLRF